MRYPPARRAPVVEVLHGHEVADPYRWLEDPDDPEAAAWSAAEDALWWEWRDGQPGREALAARLAQLVPAYQGPPTVVGERRFWLSRAPGQDHAVLHVADRDGVRVLVDPNALSPDGTVTLDGWVPSLEGDRLAYQLSEGGDEESRLWILDVATGERLDGPIDRTRYGPVAWLPGGAHLWYVRRLAPEEVPPGEEAFHRRVWLHRVGDDPDGDRLVFGEGVDKTAYLGVTVSQDGRWAAVTVSLGTAPRNDLHVADLAATGPAAPVWVPVLVGVDAQAVPHFDRRGGLWLHTDLGAPRGRLCVTDPATPDPAGWREVLAEDPGAVLEEHCLAGDVLVVCRSRHALSEVSIHDRATGALRHQVRLPGPGSADLTGRLDEGPEAWVGYTDYAAPYHVLHLDTATAALSVEPDPGDLGGVAGGGVDGVAGGGVGGVPGHGGSAGASGPAEGLVGPVRSRQVTYRSADGTEVRMSVVAAGDEDEPRRPRPTVLYGYGGFNVPMTPAYSSSVLAWVAAGGVWAVANLRGGGEEGEAWHRAGMREHKQRVFEDFEAAAAWLVAEGWTTPDQLGISGGSNGGLLVGAALTRRPERYRAVVCSAPLLDMVRYERFGLGATWNDEYGTAEDPEQLGWLLGYSPYHHVAAGTTYPAVLFTIFEGDSRVDPLHARKMAAALQAASAAAPEERPILVRREADVGHGARALRRTVELAADQLTFLAAQLGLQALAAPPG